MATITIYEWFGQAAEDTPASNPRSELLSRPLSSSALSLSDMLAQIKRLEKRSFPKEEAMDFDLELKKRNTELIILVDPNPAQEAITFAIDTASREPPKSLLSPTLPAIEQEEAPRSSRPPAIPSPPSALVIAYLLHARSTGVSLLHKVCVAEKYRRQGLARKMLLTLKLKLEKSGCERIQLWVDWKREAAIDLYQSAGFRRVDGARDYYGTGRHGIKMATDLNWVW